jgi:type VI secretion system secreted protein Hcp
MAFDAFLEISTIPGESEDENHPEWIEILSFDHGVSQTTSGSVSSGGGRTAERVDHEPFTILKTVDKASPKLNLACCNGEHIDTVKLEVCRSGRDKQVYLTITLSNVTVSSVTINGAARGASAAPIPTETVSFSYGVIDWSYTETDHSTGQPLGVVETQWDLHRNVGK